MNALDQLASLSDAALDSHIVSLAANERTSTVDLLVSLVALKRRHDAAGLGFRLWTYCHERLQMVESTASRYTSTVKLLARFPSAEPFLRDGRLNPTTFTALHEVLTEANHHELFQRASGLSQRKIDILLAELQPKPDVEESMRFVPDRTPRSPKPTSVAEVAPPATPAPVAADSGSGPGLFDLALTSAAEVERRHGFTVVATVTSGDFSSLLPKEPPPSSGRCKAKLKPLRKGHYELEINCDQQFADELEDLRMALTHVFPKADLGDAIREAVRRTLKDVQRRKFGLRSSKTEESSEDVGTSVTEVAQGESARSLAAKSPKEKRRRTSVAEVVSTGSNALAGDPLGRSPDCTSVAEVAARESISIAGDSPVRRVGSTSVAEVAASELSSSLALEPLGTPQRTSVTEVAATTSPNAPNSTCSSVNGSECTESTSVTEVPHHSSAATGTSTTEVVSDTPEVSVPPVLFNRFFFESDGDQFVPPWLRGVRSLPAELKRAVYERDGGCCAFVGSTGHRCGSRYRLEYDHWRPYARGGEATLDNIRLLCRHHNVFCAFQTFGVEVMSRYVRAH